MHYAIRRLALGIVLLVGHHSSLFGQVWNDPAGTALVRRAIARRQVVQADSTLTSYHARAHGFVFFLAQVGDGLAEPPRLIKADELDVEVYWRAPDWSKQVIAGWRDGLFLPTDIHYHRDHLGIVTNNFGDLIRLGDGDEVRDVAHPLSPSGRELYDYALGDSLAVSSDRGRVVVHEVRVRPRDFKRPRVVGTLYIDAATAELVRFRFSFTAAAYRDPQVENINVVLEQALVEQRYWLPFRQEIEIRRRTPWLDFPVRTVIRGRWEIGPYLLNAPVPPAVLAGPPIGGLRRPRPGDSVWTQALERAIADVAAPINAQDMAALRAEVERLAGARLVDGLPAQRLAAGSVSDVVRVNRVQGLTLGFGAMLIERASGLTLGPYLAYGTSDRRLTGRIGLTYRRSATTLELAAGRHVQDVGDLPVIAPVLNSVLAQESGKDFGDYVLINRAEARVRQRFGGRTAGSLTLAVEDSRTMAVAAEPANGTFRPNPPLGAGSYRVARLALERASGGIAVVGDLQGRVVVEAGDGATTYLRGSMGGRWSALLGGSAVLARVYAGIASDGLPPHRLFVMGGRGTLVGEPFRAYGGKSAAFAHVEWRRSMPVPAVSLGSFASTGRTMVVAPFVAAGWTDRPLAGLPWRGSEGVRPVAGIAVEWFMRLVRVEAGVGLRTGRLGVTVDVNRDWWGLL